MLKHIHLIRFVLPIKIKSSHPHQTERPRVIKLWQQLLCGCQQGICGIDRLRETTLARKHVELTALEANAHTTCDIVLRSQPAGYTLC